MSSFISKSVAILVVAGSSFPLTFANDDEIRKRPQPANPEELKIGECFPAMTGTSVDGRKFSMASAKKHKATVVALTSTSCPICKKYVRTLAAIEKEYSDKGIQFCFLNTLPSDDAEDIRQAIKKNELRGPYIHDKKDKWNIAFDIRTTAEVFVFDPARTLVYRGAIDDQHGLGYSLSSPRKTYLKNALDSILENQPIKSPAMTAPGCDIWIPQPDEIAKNRNSKETYHNRISRIVQKHCVECHRENGLAPFSLETADDLIAHAGMIKTVVTNKTMPPWFAEKQPPKKEGDDQTEIKFSNERVLTEAEKKSLITWLGSERKLGDPDDAPVKRVFESKWNIGTPDDKFIIPKPIPIIADGVMDYKTVTIKTNSAKDQWISAVEIRPSSPAVVHHVLVFIRPKGARRHEEEDGFFAAYVPGNTFQKFPEGFAKLLPAGATLVVQLHYTPNGTATSDQTEIGIKTFDGTPKHRVRVKGIVQNKLNIQPGDANAERHANFRVPLDVELLAFMPHMHIRGKKFKYEFFESRPTRNQAPQMLLDIPRYDFNWQLYYRLTKPFSAPKGSTIRVTGTFDNSEDNPGNPDPTALVNWGKQTTDEMLIGYIEYYIPQERISSQTKQPEAKPTNKPKQSQILRRLAKLDTAELKRRFKKLDTNNDGIVTRKELNNPPVFDSLSQDDNDHLTWDEVLSAVK